MGRNEFISVAEAREVLRQAYRLDDEIDLKAILLRTLVDPIQPVSPKGRLRPSTTVVAMVAMPLLVLALFLYFSSEGRT